MDDIINMAITREREKLLNALIFFSEHVLFPGKTKLFKLLNYLDFLHFEKTGRSVTGLKYYAWERGPVPEALYSELRQPKEDFKEHLLKRKVTTGSYTREELQPRKEFDEKYFSPFELDLMNALAREHFRQTADQISESTHFETGPWHEVYEVQGKVSEEIPYELILQRRGNEEDKAILELAKEYDAIVSHFS